eukprot:10010815-Heterocapsa_arctica.AAC.1
MWTSEEELLTLWIDVDKHEFLMLQGDTKTGDRETAFMLLSFSSSRGLRVRSADLDHSYLQGKKLNRQPRDGLPDLNIKPDDRMIAFVPIYGTKNAGRALWRQIRR